MRLVTRADFDGLVCGTVLCRKGIIDDFLFVHPQNIQNEKLEITTNDVLTNVPFDERAGLWFDHHSSEVERVNPDGRVWGICRPSAPSCARLVYEFYDGEEVMPDLADMIDACDRVDSAKLTMEEVINPTGWVLLGFICDPRTGLGRWHGFEISNRELMKLLMTDLCLRGDIEAVMSNRHVKARVDMYNEQETLYDEMLKNCSRVEDGVLITDFRNQSVIYSGNRFKQYAMFPEARVSITLMRGKGNKGVVVAVGRSIFKDFDYNIGSLMLKYKGGGHHFVGTCQFDDVNDKNIDTIIDVLKTESRKESAV